jgi:hypothetical protein
MHGWAHVMAFPRPGRIVGDLVPTYVVPVGHGEYFVTTVAIDIGDDDVVHPPELGVERDALEGRVLITAIAIPGTPGDDIHQAVSIHVQGGRADVGGRVFAQQVTSPTVGRVALVPE